MIQQELIDLIEQYCMGIQPTDAQFDEITDNAFAMGADLQEVTALMEKLQKGPTHEQLEAQRREEAARQAAEAERQATIRSLLETADAMFNQQECARAKEKYKKVVELESDNAIAIAKIQQIDNILAKKAADLTNYNNAMSSGNNALYSENYAEAIEQFQIALKYKPYDMNAASQLAIAEEMKKKADNSIRSKLTKLIDELGEKKEELKPVVNQGTDFLKETISEYAKLNKKLFARSKNGITMLTQKCRTGIAKLKNSNKNS